MSEIEKLPNFKELCEKVLNLFNIGKGERFIAKNLNITRGQVHAFYKYLNISTSSRISILGRPSEDYSEGKICSNCKQILSIDNFRSFFSKRSNKICYYSKCINCDKEISKKRNSSSKYVDMRKQYRVNNKDKLNKIESDKRKNDINFKLRKNISGAIYKGLKNNSGSKNKESILNYLSYSFAELKEHLEKQFEPWMTWLNWGIYDKNTWKDDDQLTWTWQIDHIIPHSTFKYTSMEDEDFHKCWDLNNLRPLSSKINCFDGGNKIRHN